MGFWALLVVVHALLSHAAAKRFDHSMVDPLMRRSPLDKNFMRFGRSSPAFTEPDNVHGSPTEYETRKTDDMLRSNRARESSYIRLGRSRNDNFMRFGRGKQDNFMRFGRGKQDNFMRFGRGKQDNCMRFGRGNQDNFMRFGRGKQDNFMRFGRGKQDNFMRFGRGNQYDSTQFERGKNNFIRFGRGKQDNFMRFGRGKDNNYMRFGRGNKDNFMRFGRGSKDNFMRFGRGNQGNFMRFGRGVNFIAPLREPALEPNSLFGKPIEKQTKPMRLGENVFDSFKYSSIPIAMHSPEVNDKFDRLVRSKEDNFMRFGKSANRQSTTALSNIEELKTVPLASYNTFPLRDSFIREIKSDNPVDSSSTELIPQRLKRSAIETNRSPEDSFTLKSEDSNDYSVLPSFLTMKDFPDEEYYSIYPNEDYGSKQKKQLVLNEEKPENLPKETSDEDYVSKTKTIFFEYPVDVAKILASPTYVEDHSSTFSETDSDSNSFFKNDRKKRSTDSNKTTSVPISENISHFDDISVKFLLGSFPKPDFPSSLISAGRLPNVVIGPELSLLPDLNPSSSMLKKNRPSDQNFLRLG